MTATCRFLEFSCCNILLLRRDELVSSKKKARFKNLTLGDTWWKILRGNTLPVLYACQLFSNP